MQRFVAKGKINIKGKLQKFERIVEAKSINHAKHKVICLFGSEHRLRKSSVKIESIEKLQDAQ